MSSSQPTRVDRRTAIKWMLTAAVGIALLDRQSLGAATLPLPGGQGYGGDPELNRNYKPGDFWPLTFTDEQRRAAAALCAAIIPADEQSPSAADLGVHDFIDEWISAPYPNQQRDRQPILDGLAWIDTEAKKRFEKTFASLDAQQATAICADICHAPAAPPELAGASAFFARFRNLTAGGFYTTPAGMKDIGYVGNTPMAEFKGPPRAVLAKLGLV